MPKKPEVRVKSMKVSRVIAQLEKILEMYGDKPVIMSGDTEGNSYNTIEKASFDVVGDCICIFPWADVDYAVLFAGVDNEQ